MPTESTDAQLLPFVLVATLILALLAWGRVFTPAAFARAPDRRIGLGPSDLLVALGLTIVGLSLYRVLAPALGLAAAPAPAPGADSPQRKIATVVLSQLCAHLPPLLYLIARAGLAPGGQGLTKIGLIPTRPARDLLAGLGGFICVLPVVFGIMTASAAVFTWFGHPPDPLAHDLLPLLGDERSDAAVKTLLAFSAVLLAPVFEECMYRGLLQSTLVETLRGWRWTAVLIASAVFTLIHLGGVEPPAMPGLFALAIAFGWLYERTGSLWPGILVHALFNAFNLAMAALMV